VRWAIGGGRLIIRGGPVGLVVRSLTELKSVSEELLVGTTERFNI
jgi:hypothetical protein